MPKTRTLKHALITLTAALTLAACAPSTSSNQHHTVNLGLFYPTTTGLEWQHTTPGEANSTTTRITSNNNGNLHLEQRNAHNHVTLEANLLTKRDGIYLNTVTTNQRHRQYNPPLMVLPSERNLTPGTTWNSTHTVTETNLSNSIEQHTSTWSVTLEGNVNSRQIIRTNQLTNDSYEITLRTTWGTAHDQIGRSEYTTFWFAPFTGVIITPTGKTLTNTQLTHVERAPHD